MEEFLMRPVTYAGLIGLYIGWIIARVIVRRLDRLIGDEAK